MEGYFRSKDNKVTCTYTISELEGCCGICAANALTISKFPSKCTAAERDKYAKELYKRINEEAYADSFCLLIISSLTVRGVSNIASAYFDEAAPHKRKFNLRHVAEQGGMVESGRNRNRNTGNIVVMFTKKVKPVKSKEVPYLMEGIPDSPMQIGHRNGVSNW